MRKPGQSSTHCGQVGSPTGPTGLTCPTGLTGPTLRVGAVSYLNTEPLIYQFDQLAGDMKLILDVPSRLADQLAEGRLDVALIPSIEYLQRPDYQIVSDGCIACRGPVMSVKLLSRVPMSRVTTLAWDSGSRTSVVLARILLARRYRVVPLLRVLPSDTSGELPLDADAILLIGDRAIDIDSGGFAEAWDLGEEWYREWGIPFVFAVWAAREGVSTERVSSVLSQTRDAGLAHLAEIARDSAPRVGLEVESCLGYLRDHLHFFLGAEERCGLDRFSELATEMGLLSISRGAVSCQPGVG
jgi:chorismate dehydratase